MADMTDLQMMQKPGMWPLGEILPLKRPKNHGYETAILVFVRGTYVFVPDANIFEVIELGDPRVVTHVKLEDIVSDGWVID